MTVNALDSMIMPIQNDPGNSFASFQSIRFQTGEPFGRLQ
jgi:hypothetical protein